MKVVTDGNGRALYFSRAPIPFLRDDADRAHRDTLVKQHLGIYAYTRVALDRWVSLPPHPLELVERLEQLRPLADGLANRRRACDARGKPGYRYRRRARARQCTLERSVPTDPSRRPDTFHGRRCPLTPNTPAQQHSTKFIFVTGGVVSSLGKGIAAASLGRLARRARPARDDDEVRPVHQRRSGHDEPVPAR